MTTNAEKQRALQSFVDREVGCCLSSAVYQLQKELKEDSSLEQQILELSSKQDYESALSEAGWIWRDASLVHPKDNLHWDGDYIFDNTDTPIHVFGTEEVLDAERSLCDELGIEPHEEEVLEYWAVSNWLGGKLKAQGELVDDDLLGLCVWGRTCSGQAIFMDSVIEVIYDNLHSN